MCVAIFHVTVHQIMEKVKQQRRQKLSCVWMPCGKAMLSILGWIFKKWPTTVEHMRKRSNSLCLWHTWQGIWSTTKLHSQQMWIRSFNDIFLSFFKLWYLLKKGSYGFHWTSVLAWASWLHYTLNNTGICTAHCHNATPSLKRCNLFHWTSLNGT